MYVYVYIYISYTHTHSALETLGGGFALHRIMSQACVCAACTLTVLSIDAPQSRPDLCVCMCVYVCVCAFMYVYACQNLHVCMHA